ncbi:MAG: helix-turn-helix transcriptional regulator [Bacteroidales bacterium]|nr:helix-turn-helix transcriptional regulator [Bacteroidales bacterium]
MNTILENIRTIREIKGFSQEAMAEKMNITQPKYARFERGATKTDLEMIYKTALVLGVEVIDLITYPKKYVDISTITDSENEVKAVLQIELKKEKKEQVLKLVFGDNNLEILNK